MLFIKTDTRELTINNENGEKYFDAILSMMLEDRKMSLGGAQNSEEDRPGMTGGTAEEPEEGYKGFLHLSCSRCGRTKTFHAKERMTEYRCCDCGKETPLEIMRRVYTSCDCGQDSYYLTNRKGDVLKIPCVRCGKEVLVGWNPEKKCYETSKE